MIEINYTIGWFLAEELTCKHYLTIEDRLFCERIKTSSSFTFKTARLQRKNGTDNKD